VGKEEYHVGDAVMVQRPNIGYSKGTHAKFGANFAGPMKVVTVRPDGSCVIEPWEGGNQQWESAVNLKRAHTSLTPDEVLSGKLRSDPLKKRPASRVDLEGSGTRGQPTPRVRAGSGVTPRRVLDVRLNAKNSREYLVQWVSDATGAVTTSWEHESRILSDRHDSDLFVSWQQFRARVLREARWKSREGEGTSVEREARGPSPAMQEAEGAEHGAQEPGPATALARDRTNCDDQGAYPAAP
jgi:hypothetical protein